MILVPNGFVLSAPPSSGVSFKNSRIGYQTWLRDLTAASVVASSEEALGPRDAPLKPTTYEYWQPVTLPATWEIDLGADRVIDYVGVVATLGSARASMLVETTDGTLVGSPLEYDYVQFSSEVLPANDSPLMFIDSPRTVRAIRLSLFGSGAIPQIAVVYAGEMLAVTEPIRGGGHAPLNLKRETILRQPLSRGGQFLDQSIRRVGQMGTFSFEHLESDWYRDYFDPFVVSARQYPFFFAWRPEQWPDEVGFAWSDGDIHPAYEGNFDWMSVSMNLRGLGYNG